MLSRSAVSILLLPALSTMVMAFAIPVTDSSIIEQAGHSLLMHSSHFNYHRSCIETKFSLAFSH
jgi:hypothetical protein